MAQSTNHQPRSLTHDDASAAWDDAYSYKAEIDARDAERSAPHQMPVITMAVLLVLSIVLLIAQCVLLPETL